jgi:hypothetical protein
MSTPQGPLDTDAVTNDWLEDVLRSQTTTQLADEGFTLRVMQNLPVVNVRSEQRFERWTWIGVVVGLVTAYGAGISQEPDAFASTFATLAEFKPVNAKVLAPWLATLVVAAVISWVLVDEQR